MSRSDQSTVETLELVEMFIFSPSSFCGLKGVAILGFSFGQATLFIHTMCSDAQSCQTLCDSTDCSLPGSSAHGVLLARVLEWGAISYFRGSS